MKEKITLVDIDDNILGYETKEIVHKKGLLHSAFSIFVYNNNKILLQKRSDNKYHSGGLWTNTCCSHPRENEKLDESIHRRLKEEMNFDCNLVEQFSFIYRKEFKNNIIEYELDHVFLGEYNGKVVINLDEASDYKWIEIKKVKKLLLTNPEIFTAWFIISAPKIIKIIEIKNN